jgi:hypothetical protein
MNRKLFTILMAILLFGFSFTSYSQWGASLYVQPTPSPYVSDWENTPGIATFSINYSGTETKNVEISVELTGASRGWILNGVSDPRVFETGDIISESNTEFSDWSGSGDYNESVKDIIVRSGRFPEDTYTLIIEVKDISTGNVVVHREAVFTIMAPAYPSLIYPLDEDSLLTDYPNFQWTPVEAPPEYPVSYHLTLCELLPGQTKEEAIENYPVYEEEIENQTSLLYTPEAPPLDTLKTYVWQVQAFGQAGNPLGENQGKSEIWSFSFKTFTLPEIEFEVTELEVVLPDTLDTGQPIKANIKVEIPEGASGTIKGIVSIDEKHWQDFDKYISETPATIQTNSLPTGSEDTGIHSLKVEIEEPNLKDTTLTYVVKESGKAAGELPPIDSLILIPDLAYLKDIEGTWEPVGDNFSLSGTGNLRIKTPGNKIVPVDIASLEITPYIAHPESSAVISGEVNGEGYPQLFSLYEDILKVNKVNYSAPDTVITMEAGLFLPEILEETEKPLVLLEDITVTKQGIAEGGITTEQSFTLWGLYFGIHDIGNNQAIEIGYNKNEKKFSVSLAGSIKLNNSTLTEFFDFKVEYDTDDDIMDLSGNFPLLDPFSFIPGNDYVLLDSLTISKLSDDWELLFKGRINLPEPFDTIGSRKFELSVNKNGDVTGGMDIIGPEDSGLDGDITEFDLWITTFDLTYLGFQLNIHDGELKKDSCEVQLVADLYFPAEKDTTKITLGETNNPGITVDFDGNVVWETLNIEAFQGKKIDLEVLTANIGEFCIVPSPFAFCLSGNLSVNIEGVGGSIEFEGLKVDENGFKNLEDCINGGELTVTEVVKVEVNSIDFSDSPETVKLKKNISSDEDMINGNGSIDSTGTEVDSYFQLEGATISVGSSSSTVFSGGFERLLLFEESNNTNFFLNGVEADIAGETVKLRADIEYQETLLRVAGSVKFPSDIKGIAVGKIGKKEGKPTFGLFLAASGLDMPIVPPLYLTGVGGGFFYNPDEEDIDIVKGMCGFSDEYKDSVNYNEIEPSPGKFAVLLYAGMYIAERDLVKGKALMALTENYWSIDAEIEALEGNCWGYFGLDVSWDPAYLAGAFYTEVKFYGLIKGDGQGNLYVFGEDIWGVELSGNVTIIPAIDLAELGLDFFLGAPGFMLAAEFDAGFDIYVLSGGIDFDIMVWYQRNVSWGAYASLYAHGEILGGLVGVKGGLEGAFIGSPDLIIYTLGYFKAKLCWVTVFEGSLWISIGSNGVHGGEGRNSKYDNLISSAKNMSEQMESDMEDLQGEINEALNSLGSMSDEQIAAAGQQLINGLTGSVYAPLFLTIIYTSDYQTGPPNPKLENTWNNIILPATSSIKSGKDALKDEEEDIAQSIEALGDKTEAVNNKLSGYQNLLEGEHPSIREIGVSNPVGAPTYETRTVDGEQVTFQTGFAFDESRANSNKENARGTKDDIAEYRNELHQMVDKFISNVDTIDALLHSGDQSVFSLTGDYTSSFEGLNDYYINLFEYLEDAKNLAEDCIENLDQISLAEWELPISNSEEVFEYYLWQQANRLEDLSELQELAGNRVALINGLIPEGVDTIPTEPASVWIDEYGEIGAWRKFCVNRGVELWYKIPHAGFESVINNTENIKSAAKDVFEPTRDNLDENWGNYTSELDGIYTRQSRLYEILYDLYDQLAHHAETSTAASDTGETEEPTQVIGKVGLKQSLTSLPSATATQQYSGLMPTSPTDFQTAETGTIEPAESGVISAAELERWQLRQQYAQARDLVGSYLEMPEIESFTGEARVRNDLGYAKVNLGFDASHPNGVTEYAYRIGTAGFGSGRFRSVGLKTNTHLTLLPGVDASGTYYTSIRARGRGGYTITRTQGNMAVNFSSGAASEYTSEMELPEDDNPPTTPVVEDGGDFSTSNSMLYGKWESNDYESGIQEYQYAIGTLDGNMEFEPTVRDFTSCGGMTELNVRDLSLEDGQTYYIAAKAKDGAGNWSETGRSDGIYVDGSPPTRPEIHTFYQGTGENYKTLYASWEPSSDPHSGLDRYLIYIGTTPGSHNMGIRGLYDTLLVGSYGEPLNTGTYYLTVKAFNEAGISSEDIASLEIVTDTTPPVGPYIVYFDLEEPDPKLGHLTARWNVEDPESGILESEFSIEVEGANFTLFFINKIDEDTYEASGPLGSFDRENFEFRVKATNGAGLESEGVRRLRTINLYEQQGEIEELE